MDFITFRDRLKANFDALAAENPMLFEVDANADELWEVYLNSYPAGTNDLFRKRTRHDCSECRQFMKGIGLAVSLKDGVMKSIWEFDAGDKVYQKVIDELAKWVKAHPIRDVYISDRGRMGIETNRQLDEEGKIWVWNHLYCDLPRAYYTERYMIPTKQTEYRDRAAVFLRSLQEIRLEATDTILELIADGSLYRGDEWKPLLEEFRKHQKEFAQIPYDGKLYAWEKSLTVGDALGRIRNHAIGTLLTDISAGKDLDQAVRAYETMVAPHNYKRPKPIYTQKMLDDARNTVMELGYGRSLRRRYANLDDISVNNVLFANSDAANRLIGGGDLFAELAKEATVNPRKFSNLGEVPIDRFIREVLPTADTVEVLLENRHQKNFFSLIAPVDRDAPSMFKWDNPFSWAYTGNIADSDIKQNVRKAGGNVTGDVRFSIQWNDLDFYDGNDLDAHSKEICGAGDKPSYEIYYGNRRNTSPSGGTLDVDIIHPERGVPAVENIVYVNIGNMKPGRYLFLVNVFSNRGGKSGFRAEIEIQGQTWHYDRGDVGNRKNIEVAEITVDKNHRATIRHILEPSDERISSMEIWGLKTNTFVPVTSIMCSPNYWDGRQVGNKHYFFTLDGCVNPENPNAWYNEYLKEELVANHRRVFEALGARAHVEDTHDQLSGLGFSVTIRNDLIVRVTGRSQRTMRIRF